MKKVNFPITQNRFYSRILRLLSDGDLHSIGDIRQYLTESFHLTKNDLKVRVPSGKETTFVNRFRWARNDLLKYGYIETPRSDSFRITNLGLKLFKGKKKVTKRRIVPSNIDEAAEELTKKVATIEKTIDKQVENELIKQQGTLPETSPDEQVKKILDHTENNLRKKLLERLRKEDSDFFERTVNRLIEKIYNQPIKRVQGGSNDGGIDGIIGYGFEQIAIQSKRYKETKLIGENDIKLFNTNVSLCGAPRGIFVTASSFNYNAKEIKKNFVNLRLVDGEELVGLMIEHGVGVNVEEYKIRSLDENFFITNQKVQSTES